MKNLIIFKLEPTTPNMSHHVATSTIRLAKKSVWPQDGQTRATCCAQQCCDMLRDMLRSFGRGFRLDFNISK